MGRRDRISRFPVSQVIRIKEFFFSTQLNNRYIGKYFCKDTLRRLWRRKKVCKCKENYLFHTRMKYSCDSNRSSGKMSIKKWMQSYCSFEYPNRSKYDLMRSKIYLCIFRTDKSMSTFRGCIRDPVSIVDRGETPSLSIILCRVSDGCVQSSS